MRDANSIVVLFEYEDCGMLEERILGGKRTRAGRAPCSTGSKILNKTKASNTASSCSCCLTQRERATSALGRGVVADSRWRCGDVRTLVVLDAPSRECQPRMARSCASHYFIAIYTVPYGTGMAAAAAGSRLLAV